MKLPELQTKQPEEEIHVKLYRKGYNQAIKDTAQLNADELSDIEQGYRGGILHSKALGGPASAGDTGPDCYPGISDAELPICTHCQGVGKRHIHTCPVLKGEAQ